MARVLLSIRKSARAIFISRLLAWQKILLHLINQNLNAMRKSVLSILLLFNVSLNLFAQKGCTFVVEKLSPPKTKVFATESYHELLEKLIKEDRKLSGDPNKQDLRGEANIIAKSQITQPLVTRGFHPFFEGMYAAYADHHPFTLSPDIMWLLISQGFANHVNNNSEQLRSLLVPFEGKKTLTYITQEDMFRPNAPWDIAFTNFGEQIAGFTGPELTKAMTANFTTTTPTTKIASQITLMNAVQSYFNYETMIRGCGIPKITLEGTTQDWEMVLAKAETLRKYQLDWWIDAMEPVLKQFVQASKGKIDKKFWQAMFAHHSQKGACGPQQEIVDGWIVKFFPYDKRGNTLDLKELNLGRLMPNEMLKVDLMCTDIRDTTNVIKTPLELWAGFVGLEQDAKGYGLKPKIGWMIRKKDPYNTTILARLSAANKETGGVILQVDNVPPELYKIGTVKRLRISFFGNIRIPEEMANIEIADMTLNGSTTELETKRIVKLFPKTTLHINGVDYNSN
jgi:hypothetical protein